MSRPVRMCTISKDSRISGKRSMADEMEEIEKKISQGAIDRPDLFLLPEACLSGLWDERLADDRFYVEPGDKMSSRLANLAGENHAYIAAAVLTLRNGKRRNSLLLFDRNGTIVFIYDKAHPTVPELHAGIVPGPAAPDCFETDFGKIGCSICYDLNFRDLFENYHRKGMELLLFSTYFPGGRILSNIAFDFSCFAVSSHSQGEESVFIDNYGRELARANMYTPALTRSLELDSAVLPLAENHEKLTAIRSKYGAAVEIEVHRAEAKTLIRSRSRDISVREIIAEFTLETSL